MRTRLTLVLVILLTKLSAATFYGSDAHRIVPGAIKVITDERLKTIMYAEFGPDFKTGLTHETFLAQHVLRGDGALAFEKTSSYTDQIGWTHDRYRQLINNVPVEDGLYIVHSRNGKIISVNGEYYTGIKTTTKPVLTREQAFRKAVDYFPAKKYTWEHDGHRPAESIDQSELRMLRLENGSYALCWRVDVFASEPAKRSYIYVDAATGEKRSERARMYHIDAQGTAVTGHNGTVSLTTDSISPTSFRLRNNARNIWTHDASGQDFFNASNSWTSQVNLDQYETDAHWAVEKTHEFYQTRYNLVGQNGAGMQANVQVHDGMYVNAFWNGTYMAFGDGDGGVNYKPLTSTEIVGHEYTHGVTEFSAGLVYAGESGALNESFSDVVGNAVRFLYSPNYATWLIGDQMAVPNSSGQPFRNMANPNQYGCADCYGGLYFNAGDIVHYDSGIQNYWFYLLCQGGSGTNDLNNVYNVTGIGMSDAIDIAVRNLLVYLTPNSTFLNARTFSEIAAGDLFGNCSVQQFQTGNAWYAVGVGTPYTNMVVAGATASPAVSCSVPANVMFTNQSVNSTSYVWDFGDSSPTSTATSPTHTYATAGTYTVTLIATGTTACNTGDTTTLTVTINNVPGPVAASCTPNTSAYCCGYGITNVTLNTINTSSNNAADGYSDFTCADSTLLVAGDPYTVSIQTNNSPANEGVAVFMDYNNDGVFNNTNERVFSSANGVGGLHQGIINTSVTATLNTRLRMRVISDQNTNTITGGCYQPVKGQVEDYMIYFIANSLPPNVNFVANVTTVPIGSPVNFTDLTIHAPTQWNWTFTGGVPATSTVQNPQNIIYNTPGLYPVKLVATNSFGMDSLTQVQYINVVSSVNMCSSSSFSGAYGTIYDSGGPTNNYVDNESCSILLTPVCAATISLSFTQFSLEQGYDFLTIYDGPTTASPVLFNGTGTFIPPAVNTTGGTALIVFTSDFSITNPGFTINYTSTPMSTPAVAAYSFLPANPSALSPVTFTDGSTNSPTSWSWDFGDNTTSTLQNPTHTYNTPGTYTVTLIACNCVGCDTLTQVVTVTAAAITLCNQTSSTANAGTFYDSGGSGNAYQDNESCSFLIDPCASNLTLTFSQFSLETNYDYLYVYDGTSTAAPLIFTGTGTFNPPMLTSTSGAFFVLFTSDVSVTYPGFAINWNSTPITTPPNTAFTYFPSQPQHLAPVTFTDNSTNGPISWSWNFGDNGTSNVQNPTHTYQNPGTYTVTLVACNCFSCDTLTQVMNVIVNGLGEWNTAGAYNLYPNPFTGSFTLTLPDLTTYSNVSIRLTDVAGRVLKQLQPAGKSTPVETSTLPSGMYFVEVYVDDVRMITLKAQAR